MRDVGIAIAAGVLLTASTGANAQNLLSNAGFEVQVNFDGNDVGNWNSFFGGAPFQMSEHVIGPPSVEGDFTLQIGTTGQANTFVGVSQTVDILSDNEYQFSIFAREVVQLGADVEFRIEWKDGGGNVIGDPFALNTNITGALTSDFQEFSISAMSPTDAAKATVVIAVQTFNGAPPPHEGFFQFDATSFTKIPAPGTLALLGLGAMGVARRRR